eukprot:g46617.t1
MIPGMKGFSYEQRLKRDKKKLLMLESEVDKQEAGGTQQARQHLKERSSGYYPSSGLDMGVGEAAGKWEAGGGDSWILVVGMTWLVNRRNESGWWLGERIRRWNGREEVELEEEGVWWLRAGNGEGMVEGCLDGRGGKRTLFEKGRHPGCLGVEHLLIRADVTETEELGERDGDFAGYRVEG